MKAGAHVNVATSSSHLKPFRVKIERSVERSRTPWSVGPYSVLEPSDFIHSDSGTNDSAWGHTGF